MNTVLLCWVLGRYQAGDVCYADVDHKGGGVVHFSNRDAMEYALRKLDGSEFSNRYDSAAIQVIIFKYGRVNAVFVCRRRCCGDLFL